MVDKSLVLVILNTCVIKFSDLRVGTILGFKCDFKIQNLSLYYKSRTLVKFRFNSDYQLNTPPLKGPSN